MTIKNETRWEIRAVIHAQMVLPDYWADQLVQRRIGRLIAGFAEAIGNAKRWREREVRFDRLLNLRVI
jgi:hypothetical protein